MAEDDGSQKENILTLHEMFRVVGNQMTDADFHVLKILNGLSLYRYQANLCKSKNAYEFMLALEKLALVDETNFIHILELIRIATRHDLNPFVTLRRRQTVAPDPVDVYLNEKEKLKSKDHTQSTNITNASCSNACQYSPPAKRRRQSPKHNVRSKQHAASVASCTQNDDYDIKKKLTCDIRLRVKAEYSQHENALEGNVFSAKPDIIERQFEKFAQANAILKSRDLGSIICDIKFTELTYLDAFWRDYINGSLLEALKCVFITESLKQAVGHEEVKLLVNVDEDDYENGRIKLLQNLMD